ncbi:calcium-transporting ATPase 4, plasma membrane-type-like [Castanea sativa]|uniref:calcium-transporting ATPase 4, plasma membrane-type-like n=1 Tax=Castanea sativa TaxID=21020 RepID=UPI003F64BC12
MELLLKEFEVEHKNSSEEALRRWRYAVSVVKNPGLRFRFVADLVKRSEAEKKSRKVQETIQAALSCQKEALQFIAAGGQPDDTEASFDIHPDELASIVDDQDIESLKIHGGVEGIARKIRVSLNGGVNTKNLLTRQKNYGFNCFAEKPSKKFLMLMWKSLQDFPLIIPVLSAMVSIGLGIPTEGWPKGIYDGLGGIVGMFLVIMVTAICEYKQSLQFMDLDGEKKKIFIQVTRDGKRKNVSIFDLVVGDIVHLSIGDQVPADGIYISGCSLLIDKSSLSGENEPANVNEENPFLFSGSKVQDGLGKMLVTTVGMRTKRGKLMETLNEGGEDKTPLQVKLNSVASIIGKIGWTFSVLTFLVLIVRHLVVKALNYEFTKWSSSDALTIVIYFATAVSILDVAIPEAFPLAVTLSLDFAMRKLKEERALVRHLSACETMGSASCICTDKTGTLTTNDMEVDKVWISEKSIDIKGNASDLKSEISGRVLGILLQAIFQNTGSEVVKDDSGKYTILGTPTESALLEFGLLLGGDFDAQHREFKILKVVPFNSVRRKMSVLAALPDGRVRAFCKGASEIILRMCDKIVDRNGEPVFLPEEQVKRITDVIKGFASGALRTLCLAFKDVAETSIENSIPDSGYTLIAVVGIKDPVRPGVKDAVLTCLASGITVCMVTGDNIYTAEAIARECGILTKDGMAIEGPEFRSMSPEKMKDIIPRIKVMAWSLPSDKHTLVTHLRKTFGEVVAVVTGDGINDAPAFHESDIGLAMDIAGTQVAKDSAGVIILDENFMTIVNVVRWGRAVYINNQKFLQFQLTVIVVALVLHFASACISGSTPLTAVQLLWVNFMDAVGALALATEPPNDELMKRPPVRRGVSFITKAMWRNIVGHSVYQLAVLAILNVDGKRLLNLTGSDASDVLNTLVFNSFVFCQVFNNINCREIEKINIFRGMFDSWIFLGVMVGTVAFQVIMVEFLGDFASTVPLSWQLWLLSLLLGSVSLLVAVILKCIPVERCN